MRRVHAETTEVVCRAALEKIAHKINTRNHIEVIGVLRESYLKRRYRQVEVSIIRQVSLVTAGVCGVITITDVAIRGQVRNIECEIRDCFLRSDFKGTGSGMAHGHIIFKSYLLHLLVIGDSYGKCERGGARRNVVQVIVQNDRANIVRLYA